MFRDVQVRSKWVDRKLGDVGRGSRTSKFDQGFLGIVSFGLGRVKDG